MHVQVEAPAADVLKEGHAVHEPALAALYVFAAHAEFSRAPSKTTRGMGIASVIGRVNCVLLVLSKGLGCLVTH